MEEVKPSVYHDSCATAALLPIVAETSITTTNTAKNDPDKTNKQSGKLFSLVLQSQTHERK